MELLQTRIHSSRCLRSAVLKGIKERKIFRGATDLLELGVVLRVVLVAHLLVRPVEVRHVILEKPTTEAQRKRHACAHKTSAHLTNDHR